MKRQTLIFFVITFMLLAPLSSLGTHALEEQDTTRDFIISDVNWLNGYAFRKSHDITGSVGAETDYQILINVTRATGSDTGNNVFVGTNCQTDFADIRFTDDNKTTELDYWLETNTTEYGMFWVEVSDDLDANQVIYVYYGNEEVSTTSDGDTTFLFYEDWSTESVRSAVWDETDGDGDIQFFSVLDGAGPVYGEEAHGFIIAKVEGDPGANTIGYESDLDVTAPTAIMFRAKIEHTEAADQRIRIGSGSPSIFSFAYIESSSTTHRLTVYDDDANDDHQTIDAGHLGDYHLFQITRDGTSAKLYVDRVLEETASCSPDVIATPLTSFLVTDEEYDLYSDWFAGRKLIATEPSHGAWGDEEIDTRGWHSFTMEEVYFDLPGWNVFTMEDIFFYIPISVVNISYLLMLGGLVMIPTSTILLVKGGRSEMSREKLFLFLLMFLFGWALFLGGIL